METLKLRWKSKYGYTPTELEIVAAYRSGELELKEDWEENALLRYISENNL